METAISSSSSIALELYRDILNAGPKSGENDPWNNSRDFEGIERFRSRYSYAAPSQEAIQRIISFTNDADSILEIGAGRALWACLINLETDSNFVRPTDYANPETNWYIPLKGGTTWIPVEQINAKDAVERVNLDNPDKTVLMSIWPAYSQDWSGEALSLFKGNKFIYIGESEGGCTGGDNLFEELWKNWELVETVDIPQWRGMHDAGYLYVRKGGNT